ncbi:hypothetical protein [Pseudomonas sp. B33.4]|uniref:hypothetical protein n=1 Tax=Pseudomonas sp. B33.4 TaxID=3104265 RepID=UPI002ADEC08B|nr:hypothetical protein [Pseudomonas sp. B33.4]
MDTDEEVENLPPQILELHASKDEYDARLRVSCSWSADGKRFSCHAREYWAKYNGRTSGNIILGFSSLFGSWSDELTDEALQFGLWNGVGGGGEISTGSSGIATVYFTYIYDRANTPDVEMFTSQLVVYKPPAPEIDVYQNFVGSTFNVTGNGGINGATLVLDNGDGTIGSAVLISNGRWSVPVTVANHQMSQKVQAYQMVSPFNSERTRFVTGIRARITSPSPGSLLTIKDLVFKGAAAPGYGIRVVNDENRQEYLTGSAIMDPGTSTWQANPSKTPPSGLVSATARLTAPYAMDLFTEVIRFGFMGLPEIQNPPPSSVQDQSFLLEGGNGLHRARLRVLPDLADAPVLGSEIVGDDRGAWTGLVEVPPGPISLVVEQDLNGVSSGRSAPRAFRIRPPKLEKPEVTFLPDTSLKFSGTGHFDQNLSTEIQFSASNGSLPLPPNIRVDGQGQWETAPVVWPLGSYKMKVIQKIADNANGWIDSHPLEFEVDNDLPDITEATYTEDYQPTFSGKGYTGATVSLRDCDENEVARSVLVVNGQWSTRALVEWGPTSNRAVHITQHLEAHSSKKAYVLNVTIAPLAPGLDDPPEEGLEPIFRGTCLTGATVSIKFLGDAEEHLATVTGDTWEFQRKTPFQENVEYTVEVTQKIIDLTSAPASKTFTLHRVLLQPLITVPVSGSDVGYDVTIEGDNGLQGAVMQLHDSQFGRPLGAPLELLDDGKWSIDLRDLDLRKYFLHAQQTLNGRDSANSAEHNFNVVVPPPRFTTPIPGGKASRISKIAGTGRPTAHVEVWLEDATEPLLTAIEVNALGNWEAEVSLPVGNKTIWAFQTFVYNGSPQRSQANERLRYKVVPAAPFIETPTADDHVGRRVVVSGFATPGDTVTVTLGSGQASAEVRENRTWSVTLEPGPAEGNHELEAVAAYEGYESDSANRSVQLATYLPTIDTPAPGRWVSTPVTFAGKGRPGVGVLVDPFNPDKTWIALLPVIDTEWQGESDQALPSGGNWCRFRLQPSDSDPTGSDWVVSARFEVESALAEKTIRQNR